MVIRFMFPIWSIAFQMSFQKYDASQTEQSMQFNSGLSMRNYGLNQTSNRYQHAVKNIYIYIYTCKKNQLKAKDMHFPDEAVYLI